MNILSPGPIDTAIMEPLGAGTIEFLKSQIPGGELGRPEEVATVALFLASNDSSFVNESSSSSMVGWAKSDCETLYSAV